ncbi:uncharacterized protein LOC110455005 isoform X1 [Mizuhopecten yessoensis]|uniref:uncharacterized protein LOC110455005 isoform X1 n=1 Tax=Mizuhopecten yessoensis TaxID=6573 RepID=UPI000B4578CD|nr:uncharacterized protein LOC110455005 isoform X1 [Mizuhopecten yessoensis]
MASASAENVGKHKSGGTSCCMIGCDNNHKKLNEWKTSICEEHGSQIHNDCTCLLPFSFYILPSADEMRLEWIKAINRETLPKHVYVCSEHFVEGKPTRENPYPALNLGYETVTKQLRMLTFANPGKFMDNFDPERSAREMRKMNRRIYRENIRKNQLYDETGVLLDNSLDLCDCLDMECEGCHFPCPKCGSEKCGTECRCCRKWFYEHVEVEGTNLTLKWPIPTQIPTSTS